ncbi:sugar O-acetyltransferase [Aspergillus clavatus NRRL 1]|uniref:Acetyltransferase, CysE/LacA/LpxA/NodL family n=1 Tax=Aspergillus clavatus (strain ATCC 1007 / CBS 513.65 / DSM 816 / NCTC 3887 / NRRL 1 / QM 1276 / 107) TaxID=344612 RepID=A1CSQ5_ASPCL|nr:acetyltransferase, CysE/LacA/LpxA/NodL family [Aspergillus clavatus NRRL 1]EAW06342.1 acetyltransferase, CysE/LacA/LpxA/NodL family [Aspergillus clavatus NRRL 1]
MSSAESQPSEREKMLRGELYYAYTPELTAARMRCKHACNRFNNAGEVSRRRLVELWKDITEDKTPLPPPRGDPEADEALLAREPWIEGPIRIDYGFNVRVGEGAFINSYCTIIDTCLVTIGARTLFGPNVSLFSGTHPLDPALRNGIKGPEYGKEIHIGEDCWLGGNVTVLPGVTIGKGATIGAGSVVTKDVPAFHLAYGNPARVIRKIETSMTE